MVAIVALVTPASKATPSVKAFEDEIGRLNSPANFKPYPAGEYNDDLGKAAHQAFVDVNANGGILVAAGAKAAGLLQNETTANPDIPIILAFGGEVPDNAGSNMTGFIGNTIKAARQPPEAAEAQGPCGHGHARPGHQE